jgi:hypothetical protein
MLLLYIQFEILWMIMVLLLSISRGLRYLLYMYFLDRMLPEYDNLLDRYIYDDILVIL